MIVRSLAVLVTAGALVAGCGSGGDDTTSTGASAPAATTPAPAAAPAASGALTLAASDTSGLKFDKKTLTAKAGKVTITMDNPSGDSQPHAVAIEGHGVDEDGQTAQPGDTSTVTATLKPGKYTFYCPIPGHRAAGMEGTLTVR